MSSATLSEDGTTIAPRARRWHIAVFLLPAFIVYTAVMILPLIETLRLSLFNTVDGQSTRSAWDRTRSSATSAIPT